MLNISIRWRLTLWYAAALAAILAVFCSLLIPLTYQQLLARMDAELQEELQELYLEVQLAEDPSELDVNLAARFRQHETFDFVIFNESQAVLFASSGVTSEVAAQLSGADYEFETRQAMNDASYRIATRTVEEQNGKLVIKVLTPLKPLITDIETLFALIAVLLPIGILFALFGGYFLAARALAPVEQIARVADSITISQLDRRIAVANPHDELGHLAGTLNRLIARLERAVEEIRRFTADASHELRTPLAVLRSEAESMLRKTRTEEEYKTALRVIVEEATRLGTLADQLLTLSRQDAGLAACEREPVQIDALLQDVVELLRPLSESRSVTLSTNQILECEALGDDVRLSQAFFNVLENAIKYSSPDSTIEVETTDIGQQVQVTICDHGIGIPTNQLERVFDRFHRVDSSRNRSIGGTGLGLAITQAIIVAHQGTVELHSELNAGTKVVICLPKASSSSENLSPPETNLHESPIRGKVKVDESNA
ncbi:sensor histidine kinase [Blastopirellula marina]|uniref:histidine kinase n=1 Tax=Blastopirellula marina DSM 3645 TaxID=314230 RepID=A3ZX59_9BACT|nr:ATP-binding protein [Blastopirellula marina]EAQ78940.1 heavy metal sensor signal transduction histidine kinase [Blastopirellula marina DSM 3645]